MKSWEYRVFKDINNNCGIIEVYYNESGAIKAYSNFIKPHGENLKELKSDMLKMSMAFERPQILENDLPDNAVKIKIERQFKPKSFFSNIKQRFLLAFGFRPYVEITNEKTKVVWKRTWEVDWKEIKAYTYSKLTLKPSKMDKQRNFIRRIYPRGEMTLHPKGVYSDMKSYVSVEAVKLAVENPVNHIGTSSTKIGELLRK